MSYILEALQKSEHARQRGKVPDLNSVPVMLIPAHGRRPGPPLAYVLAAAVVLVLVAVLAWLQPWQVPATVVVTVPAEPVRGEAPTQDWAPTPPFRAAAEPRAEPSSIGRQPATVMPAPVVAQAQAPAPGAALPGALAPSAIPTPAPAPVVAPVAATPPAEPGAQPVAPPPPVASAAVTAPRVASLAPAAPAPVKAAPSPRVAAEAAPPGARPPATVRDAAAAVVAPSPARVYRRTELPDAIRSSLPALTISGYAYAEQAAERMAVINDRLVQEGDEAAPGVTVANIDSDGLVLVFRGYRFRP